MWFFVNFLLLALIWIFFWRFFHKNWRWFCFYLFCLGFLRFVPSL
jgi:hypothetical protein